MKRTYPKEKERNMITIEQRSKVDKIWLDFHSNGIAIPSDVMEQFNYLVFMRLA